VSAHIAPHRWADAFAGKLADEQVAQMDAHAEACPRCARARERVRGASQSFPALRAQSAPELQWDTVRARVHWSVSSEKRASRRSSGRTRVLAFAGLGALAAGGIAVAVLAPFGADSPSRAQQTAQRDPATTIISSHAPAAVAPTALAAIVVRETGEQRYAFDKLFTAGDVVTTHDARLDLQFDEASALSLGPRTILSVRRLDSEQIELYLQQGSLDVTVTKRSPDQRFLVSMVTGRTVEVRGTQFRVVEAGTTSRVECAHGKVALRDGSGEVEIAGARKVELGTQAQVANVRPTELSADELKVLVDATPLTMPMWPGAAQLAQQSGALEIASEAVRPVRVDGVELGAAPLRVRVMPGRHTVETADRAGRFRRSGWVDASAGRPARLDVRADEPETPNTGIATRKQQLLANLDRARVASCTRAIAKAGVTDTYVRIEIAIDATGAVQFLNVIDTDLPSTTASCVREAIADVHFAPGPAATFRLKL
jgi:hypothetical protein